MAIPDHADFWVDETIRAFRLASVQDHSLEADINRIVDLAEPNPTDIALDIVTGLGHIARALAGKVSAVDAVDPDEKMLDEAMEMAKKDGITNINFTRGDPLKLPVETDKYDIVTARMALRHLGDGTQCIREVHRVIKPSGRFLIADSLAPPHTDLEDFLSNLMQHRDRSHVRSYTLAELETLLERENFDIDLIEIYPKEHDFESWAKRTGADDDTMRMIVRLFQGATDRVKRHFRAVFKDNKLVSFVTWMILIRSRPAQTGES
jgi:ubiquinone/menaquinone biosynthesis C-methylase UbiE